VVTVSATYGAGGSVVAPRLADRLGLPFLDRLVTATVSHDAWPATDEGLTSAEKATAPGNRLFTYLARAAGANVMVPADAGVDPDLSLREQLEAEVFRLARGGGVLLGRAGAIVLADRPNAYHVRLDGPKERRLERAKQIEGMTPDECCRRLAETDRARTLYVRRLYRADLADSSLYHLVLDTTVLSTDEAVDMLAAAAEAYFRAGSLPQGRA
jgi:cytidylate kinase